MYIYNKATFNVSRTWLAAARLVLSDGVSQERRQRKGLKRPHMDLMDLSRALPCLVPNACWDRANPPTSSPVASRRRIRGLAQTGHVCVVAEPRYINIFTRCLYCSRHLTPRVLHISNAVLLFSPTLLHIHPFSVSAPNECRLLYYSMTFHVYYIEQRSYTIDHPCVLLNKSCAWILIRPRAVFFILIKCNLHHRLFNVGGCADIK